MKFSKAFTKLLATTAMGVSTFKPGFITIVLIPKSKLKVFNEIVSKNTKIQVLGKPESLANRYVALIYRPKAGESAKTGKRPSSIKRTFKALEERADAKTMDIAAPSIQTFKTTLKQFNEDDFDHRSFPMNPAMRRKILDILEMGTLIDPNNQFDDSNANEDLDQI